MSTVVYPATWERVSAKFGANTLEYVKEPDGTCYKVGTPIEVIRIIEGARFTGQIIRVFYGDVETGSDWMEEHDTIGRVSRSMGPVKVPLLLANTRSSGGGAILTDSIVRITIDKHDVYRHPSYHQPELTTGPAGFEGYAEGAYQNGENVANFRKVGQAAKYVAFMKGERNAK